MAVYACNTARCIAPVTSDDQTLFMVGTQLLREPNEIHLLAYEPDSEAVRCVGVYPHQQEIWDLAPSPSDPSKIFTCYNSGTDFRAALWETEGPEGGSLRSVLVLDSLQSDARRVLWSPDTSSSSVLVVEEEGLSLWNIAGGSPKAEGRSSGAGLQQKMWSAAWSPHDPSQVAAVAGNQVSLWDLRALKQTRAVDQAHSMPARTLQFNPKNPHILATGGDDCMLKVWDCRALERPLCEVAAHSHAIWQLQYSPFHDRLLLTASSDTNAALWTVLSQSVDGANAENLPPPASPTGGTWKEEREPADAQALLISDHDDSVVGAAWSTVDPWTFATLSYDGRVIVGTVPKSEKYKILL